MFVAEPIIDPSARTKFWRPGKSVVNDNGFLTANLQNMMLTFLLLSLFVTCILLILLERGTSDTSGDRWRKPFKIGVLDPEFPHVQMHFSTDKVFSTSCKRTDQNEDIQLQAKVTKRELAKGRTLVNDDLNPQSCLF